MQREIKFRAWNKNDETFTYFDLNDQVEPMGRPITQFTGLKDKNGKEIYEGDLIKADWHWEEPVEVELGPFWFHEMIEYGLDGKNFEVIGNIYENPELLK